MSNNKQSMKLYTEEQLRTAIEMAREGIMSKDNIIGSLNFMKPPIELPSDEEIKKEMEFDWLDPDDVAYLGGAIWMRDKIQGSNNEQQ